MSIDTLKIRGARQHNLKNISVDIPRNRFVVITGLSGSGKSSLAFDTIYAEGQRRYVESLSAYARQFLEQMDKPDVDAIEGLSPAISIEQRGFSRNPRSTVGTVTEIYDYMRVLFARIGQPYCPECSIEIRSQTIQQIVDQILGWEEGSRIQIMAPLLENRKGEHRRLLQGLRKDGFTRVRIDGTVRLLDDDILLEKKRKHTIQVVVDRLVVKPEIQRRLTDSMELTLSLGKGRAVLEVMGSGDVFFNQKAACPKCGLSMPELTPQMFSFNNPAGACPECSGLGTKRAFDPALVIADPALSLQDGAITAWPRRFSGYYQQMLCAVLDHYGIERNLSFKDIQANIQEVILYGSGREKIPFEFQTARRKHSRNRPFEGVIPNLERRYRETHSYRVRYEIEKFMSIRPCTLCQGARLKATSLAVRVGNRSIHELTALSVDAAYGFFDNLVLRTREKVIAKGVLKEIRERLGFLRSVGLEYLTLDRSSGTLSGGEDQRIRLATQISSRLAGVLYVLDEPSIGLHQRDNLRLLKNLKQLKELGNTVLVVEHDAETILMADHVIDMGPGAGIKGGEVVFSGPPRALVGSQDSLTGQYLSGRRSIPVPAARRKGNRRALLIKGARLNNLKNISVKIPLATFTCVTGVSGSGKSSLINGTLYPALSRHLYGGKAPVGPLDALKGMEHLDKVINIDQSPIGRTPRSNPATYTGAFAHIRDLFSMLPESRARGYKPGRFSFNVKGGRCEACKGDGINRIEMHFLPDVYVTCEVCGGLRYNRDTLEIKYKGKSIAEVLHMTVNQALAFFEAIPPIQKKLKTLVDVGVGYIKLGQQATTLSGGEAQRIKLSRELSKRSTGKTLYLLDEPTTGLHFADIEKLLEVLNRLVERKNTVVVIEHNLDVVKGADHVIDLGPEGGAGGGQVVAAGTPEAISKIETSYTGQYLKKLLETKKQP